MGSRLDMARRPCRFPPGSVALDSKHLHFGAGGGWGGGAVSISTGLSGGWRRGFGMFRSAPMLDDTAFAGSEMKMGAPGDEGDGRRRRRRSRRVGGGTHAQRWAVL